MIRICSTEEVPKGSVVSAALGDLQVAMVHAEDDQFYAIFDECSHAAIPLSEGEVEGCTLECWLHGSRFDLRTGEPTGLPATESVPVYPVEVHDGAVYVDIGEVK
ncbi:non-heme iron oxygenase ferredoxin subunit [Natronosporangium hydrolyticum]|uniref:Non-heme iron oxygenase ferredoxin subunit n=1 Tax=Natronosporangium hydrolyticum TaxID=2811111 RepID=A0A895Y986_9ACTN|nr:non-heme iron oxygenase ferredoxin subunit [Natronosporangium hydrolyticum]QSB12885.1 non-heme iron oxygenase ferredoxin subunit [Natronosporangium hydrolyticum]